MIGRRAVDVEQVRLLRRLHGGGFHRAEREEGEPEHKDTQEEHAEAYGMARHGGLLGLVWALTGAAIVGVSQVRRKGGMRGSRSQSVSSPASRQLEHCSMYETPCSLQKYRWQRLQTIYVMRTRSFDSHT
ncbi:hypothetical protein NITMOv2_2226 [Nitrospira moscoviensis]|uniref:Uncharacterized protein n=1 Tax=Nitrospira moscoviensis TaxID=42253 RepID=A0A0K2GDE9_NITMO|nr:hypothetical protein NITMOv2_2226 [Nitrospira moscoviensis]